MGGGRVGSTFMAGIRRFEPESPERRNALGRFGEGCGLVRSVARAASADGSEDRSWATAGPDDVAVTAVGAVGRFVSGCGSGRAVGFE